MQILSVTPMLRTPDVKTTVAFYTETLGFICDGFNDEWTWASLRRDQTVVMISAMNEHDGDETPIFTGSLYFLTDDVDKVWEELRTRARICYPIENFDCGMREFAIYDNNGYLLQFGQPVKK